MSHQGHLEVPLLIVSGVALLGLLIYKSSPHTNKHRRRSKHLDREGDESDYDSAVGSDGEAGHSDAESSENDGEMKEMRTLLKGMKRDITTLRRKDGQGLDRSGKVCRYPWI